jgi:mannose-1-phosphate guanylyltransferase
MFVEAVERPVTWVVVLAGGEGNRMRPAIETWLGCHRPKQYCTFTGSRSMLQHTLDRASALAAPDRTVTVLGPGHRRFLEEAADVEQCGLVLEQPRNLGTAPGALLPLACILERDPEAIAVLMPSDHFVRPEGVFVRRVRQAVELAARETDALVLVGAVPDAPETDYGWIVPGSRRVGVGRAVDAFREKPPAGEAAQLLATGALWNTMVVVARAATLWSLAWQHLPALMPRFHQLRQTMHVARHGLVGREHERLALEHIYHLMPAADLSRGLLRPAAGCSLVLTLDDVEWSDWGRPERVADTLHRLDKRPAFTLPAPYATPFAGSVG